MPRRLNLSGTGLDIVLALSQAGSARASDLAAALHVPLTTVDAAVRVLLNIGVIDRDARHRRYVLRQQHPALAELVALAERMPSADRAMDIVMRANDAVEFAGHDEDGYIVAVDPGAAADLDIFDAAIERILAGRDPAIRVIRFTAGDFDRLLRVVPSLRARAVAAHAVKGVPGRSRVRRASA